MIFWVLIAALTAGSAALLVRQLVRRTPAGPTGRDGDVAVYAAQLRDLEAEMETGRVTPEDAAPLRAEIARRLLRAERLAEMSAGPADCRDAGDPATRAAGDSADDNETSAHGGASPPTLLAGLVIACTAGASLLVYLAIGTPNAADELERSAALRAQNEAARRTAQRGGLTGQTVQDLVKKVEQRLAAVPEDGRGWAIVAPIYVRLNRFADAAKAYERAIELVGETPERRVGRGEALVLSAQGQVTSQARAEFARAAELNPRHTMAHAWLAEASAQAGDLDAAKDKLRDLLARPETAPNVRPMLAARLAAFERGAGADRAFASAPASQTGQEIARALPAQQRQQIAAMVAVLQERLFSDGGSAEEWSRLIRSRLVLGQRDEARRALRIAQQTLSGTELRAPIFAQLVQALAEPGNGQPSASTRAEQ